MTEHPLKVLFVITSMPVGGAETLLVSLIRALDRKRLVPEICCLKEPGPLGEQVAAEVPLHSRLIRGRTDVAVVERLRRLMRDRHIDAVVTVGAGDKMFWGRIAARLAGVPVVLSALHSTGWPDGIGRLNRMLTPLTDGFIAVARRHGDYLADVEHLPRHRVFVIPNGVDTDRFRYSPELRLQMRQQWNIPATAPVVGIVAALRPEKNHGRFLETARRVADEVEDLHLVITGDGPERAAIESRASQLGLADRLRMTGNSGEIPGILSMLDLFALSSDNEANPVSILEALSCQRPVVAPLVGSIDETVRHGQTGFVYERDDVAAAAQHWCEVLGDPALAAQLGRMGRALVEAEWSLRAMANGYMDLIAKLWSSKTRARSPGPARQARSLLHHWFPDAARHSRI